MSNQIKTARVELGLFIKNRREEMGLPIELLSTFVGLSANTLSRIEEGLFPWDIDTHHKILAALEIKPYFHATKPPDTEDYLLRAHDDPERYHGFYIIENILLHPGHIGVLKLTYPRMFVSFKYGAMTFIDFEEWELNHTEVQFLDPEDKPSDRKEIKDLLIDCWNFLSLTEMEEDRLAEERENDD